MCSGGKVPQWDLSPSLGAALSLTVPPWGACQAHHSATRREMLTTFS